MKIELRYASHPEDVKKYDTEKLRKEFLIENVFIPERYLWYTLYMTGILSVVQCH